MIEAGKYKARPISWALGMTDTEKEQVAVEIEFLDLAVTPRTLWWYGYFTPNALESTVKALRAMGWEGDDLATLQLQDREVEVVVEHEDYKGVTRPRIRWINAPGGGPAVKKPLGTDQARAFATKMRGAILAVDQKMGRKPAGGAAQQAGQIPPAPSDEIPF